MNGDAPSEGRVEVCSGLAWGTVCDVFWTQEDANVACRQAGFSRFGEPGMCDLCSGIKGLCEYSKGLFTWHMYLEVG